MLQRRGLGLGGACRDRGAAVGRASQGLVIHLGLNFGLWTNIIGLAVLLLWIPLRQQPGLGTVLNVADDRARAHSSVLWLLPEQESLWVRIPLLPSGCSPSRSRAVSTSGPGWARARGTG